MRRRSVAALLGLGLLLAACTSAASDRATSDGANPAEAVVTNGPAAVTTTTLPGGATQLVSVGSPSIGPGGNRVAEGIGAIDVVTPVDVELPGTPVLVLPVLGPLRDPGAAGIPDSPDEEPVDDEEAEVPRPLWYVELDTGLGVVVDESFAVVDGVLAERPGTVDGFDEPLPDGIVVEADGLAVALVQPTDRYPHGALGDRIEAAAVQVLGPTGEVVSTFGPEPPAVIEGISALVADATGDGSPEILVTQSDADQGASLALWSPDGDLIATSDGIGQGNRWRNQLAIAPVGPDGEIEIIDVRTPHIGGTVQYFRVDGSRLVLVASRSGFTSHRLGSRNLDLGIVADADGDGRLDVLVPTDRREAIGVLARSDGAGHDGVEVVAELDLPGRLTTNLGVAATVPDGVDDGGDPLVRPGLSFAVGTDEGVLRIWPAPDRSDR